MMRLTGIDDVASWIHDVDKRGAHSVELWLKLRGQQKQTHAYTCLSICEPLDEADKIIAKIESDPRVENGSVVYALLAYNSGHEKPIERALVYPAAHAVASVVAPASSAPMANVLGSLGQMTQGILEALQRENNHQRQANEQLFRASHGHLDAMTKSYHKFIDSQDARLEAATQKATDLRRRIDEVEDENKSLRRRIDDLEKQDRAAIAEIEQKELRDKFLMQNLDKYLPHVIHAISNRNAPKELGILHSFLRTISPQQSQQLFHILSDNQLSMLQQLQQSLPNNPTDTPTTNPQPSTNINSNTTNNISGVSFLAYEILRPAFASMSKEQATLLMHRFHESCDASKQPQLLSLSQQVISMFGPQGQIGDPHIAQETLRQWFALLGEQKLFDACSCLDYGQALLFLTAYSQYQEHYGASLAGTSPSPTPQAAT